MALINLGKTEHHDISLDLQTLISTRLLIQASSGGGKSYAIRRLLEQSHGQIQQLVIDLEGEFLTLREEYDYVIAGKGGDTPADPRTAKQLAKKLLELGVSAICDISELRKHERFSFVKVFLEALISAPRSSYHPVLVVVDEAHQWCPQAGQAESAGAVIDLCTRGRKRGLCAVLATQRLSKLHKDACAELLNKMIGRTSLDIDQKRAADELGLSGRDDRIALRKLSPGDFHIYGPALRYGKNSTGEVMLMRVDTVKSKHPQVGAKFIEVPSKPTDKIKHILAQLADLPEIAEKEQLDIDALRRENSELKRKLTLADKAQPAPKPCNHEPIIKSLGDQVVALKKSIQATGSFFKQIDSGLLSINKIIDPLIGIAERAQLFIEEQENIKVEIIVKANDPANRPIITKASVIELPNIVNSENGSILNGPRQRILNALAALEQFGISDPTRNTLAAHANYTPNTGGYGNNLGALRTAELIDYPGPGLVCLTEAGRSIAVIENPIDSIDDLHRSWLSIIKSNSQKKILNFLIKIYPKSISRDELGSELGFAPRSGGFGNNLGKLRTLGAIEYPSKGMIKASNLLFPEGLY